MLSNIRHLNLVLERCQDPKWHLKVIKLCLDPVNTVLSFQNLKIKHQIMDLVLKLDLKKKLTARNTFPELVHTSYLIELVKREENQQFMPLFNTLLSVKKTLTSLVQEITVQTKILQWKRNPNTKWELDKEMIWLLKKDRDSSKLQATMNLILSSPRIRLQHGALDLKRDKILPEEKIRNLFQVLDPIRLNLKSVKVLITEWVPN